MSYMHSQFNDIRQSCTRAPTRHRTQRISAILVNIFDILWATFLYVFPKHVPFIVMTVSKPVETEQCIVWHSTLAFHTNTHTHTIIHTEALDLSHPGGKNTIEWRIYLAYRITKWFCLRFAIVIWICIMHGRWRAWYMRAEEWDGCTTTCWFLPLGWLAALPPLLSRHIRELCAATAAAVLCACVSVWNMRVSDAVPLIEPAVDVFRTQRTFMHVSFDVEGKFMCLLHTK